MSYTDGTPDVSFAYSPAGERCWMYQGSTSSTACGSPPSGAVVYSYDTLGRLVQLTNAAGATVTYGYDSQSRLNCVSYPNAAGDTCSSSGTPTGVLRYSYNSAGQLSGITDWAGDTLSVEYNQDGQICLVSTSSSASCSVPATGVTTAYSYDVAGSLSDLQTTSSGTNLLDLSVGSRNPDEFIKAETPTVGPGANATDSYTYNSNNQVASGPIAGSSGSSSYSYTQAGGITGDTTSFASAAYDQAGVLCWTAATSSGNGCLSPPSGATTYSYNADGERIGSTPTSGNPQSYGWNTLSGRLTCVDTDGTTCSSSGTTYTYDGDGLRTSSTTASVTTQYTWGTEGATPQLLSDGTWDYVYLPGSSTPIEQIATSASSPQVDLLLDDESGNARGLVQLSAGANQAQLVNYTDYDAFGNPITGSGGVPESGGLSEAHASLNSNFVASTPWGFARGYTDDTGLVYLVHRYYDPATAQLLSVDPMLRQTQQPYELADDNPLARSDAQGLAYDWPYYDLWCNHNHVKRADCLKSTRPLYEYSWLTSTGGPNGVETDTLDIPAMAISVNWVDSVDFTDVVKAENECALCVIPPASGPSAASAVTNRYNDKPELVDASLVNCVLAFDQRCTASAYRWPPQYYFSGRRLEVPDGLLTTSASGLTIPGSTYRLFTQAYTESGGAAGGTVGIEVTWYAPKGMGVIYDNGWLTSGS